MPVYFRAASVAVEVEEEEVAVEAEEPHGEVADQAVP